MDQASRAFEAGQRVRSCHGEVLTVLRQEGSRVFVMERSNDWFHTAKLFSIRKRAEFSSWPPESENRP